MQSYDLWTFGMPDMIQAGLFTHEYSAGRVGQVVNLRRVGSYRLCPASLGRTGREAVPATARPECFDMLSENMKAFVWFAVAAFALLPLIAQQAAQQAGRGRGAPPIAPKPEELSQVKAKTEQIEASVREL